MYLLLLLVTACTALPNHHYDTAAGSTQAAFIKLVTEGPPDKTCADITCGPNEWRVSVTCVDIRCAAGERCDDLPDGPDCVPDVPTCEGFFCRRGTNCYIRQGSPICLPNTCEVRECEPGLNCIDTPDGALCRKGELRGTCTGKYCPPNTVCELTTEGPTCAHI
ncbi:hypothetical protein FJT64_021909 [Amphibalanus amphitrite]|uniref:Follistatin-like domain-containing protein n=1 Tax=Amphibalanus amphitrite TaxID=1232801 RepID=A0A6A4WSF9_AMPAM|nr:hypothetical protein FJT64_021909 [Amphibalanus amphitrite]